MDATSLWIIYVVTLILTFFILYFILSSTSLDYPNNNNFNSLCFITALIGAIVVFIALLWIDPIIFETTDKISISILMIIAFLLPVIIIIYLVWNGCLLPQQNTECITDAQSVFRTSCDTRCNKSNNNIFL